MDDASFILPHLLVGRAPLTPDDVASLKRRGVTAVLCLQTDEDLAALGLAWARLKEWYDAAGVEAHHLPIEDWSPQAVIARMDEAVQAVRRLLRRGHVLYLHCTAGANRSPSIALAYLCKVQGEPMERALSRIIRCRPQAAPYPEVLEALRLARGA
ncbi:MAG: dual specificity protein phosphatase family protein [Armatimonadota bacterium]|nr:dual specificity protein phosphatase family protein [Armatimonadota bacterium]MDR7427849.1 dual specificity protein phosphatase family protein [Armatimonadota bacterium]MDR7471137.1 dual specificity protein phosphatase family protein [Armatimonadota bacterium]MDR7475313.1 dual specificity protein phosphatase family protein [Armatimonadota bacterium]MDR7539954.1 dual specificity protein phosphatase family protein [Armatimonadota bacterium]